MKNTSKYSLILFFSALTALSYGTNTISIDSLNANINLAFVSIERIDSIFFDPSIKQEFISDYLKNFTNLPLKKFDNEGKITTLNNYYSTQEGIRDLILKYNGTMTNNEISLDGMNTDMTGHHKSDNPDVMMMRNYLNKYALFFPKTKQKNYQTELYLNSKYICLVEQAKNGIRVQRNKKYLIEFKSNNKIDCSTTITFSQQEQIMFMCRGEE